MITIPGVAKYGDGVSWPKLRLRSGLPEVDVRAVEISGDSIFLICSDGLWESMRREEMEECFRDMEKTVECLFKGAIAGGGRDNISAIVVRIRDI